MIVNDMLSMPSLKDLHLIAGKDGLSREIKSVNIMDNPEALDWLSAGEVLLTSGYFFKDSAENQNQFVVDLANIGCPCLCIKPKRFLRTIPDNMIEVANQIGLPIFEIPYGLSFSQILVVIMDEISKKNEPIIKKSLEIHHEFFEISLEGGGLDHISKKLAAIVGNPVIFLDEGWRLLHYYDVADSIPLNQYFDFKIGRPLFNEEFLSSMPYEVDKFRKPITRKLKVKDAVINVRIMPAVVANKNYGYILLCETARKITEIDFIALTNASMVFSMERIRQKELEDVRANLRSDFFDDLLTGKFQSLDDVKNQCDLLGIDPTYQYYCLVITTKTARVSKFDDMVKAQYAQNEAAKKIIGIVREISHMEKKNVLCFQRGLQIIVMDGRDKRQPSFIPQETLLYAQAIYDEMERKLPANQYKIGIGRTYDTIMSAEKSFREACQAIRILEKFQLNKPITQYEDFEVYHFLEDNISVEEREKFFRCILGELHNYDQKNQTEFLVTLASYIAHNYNATEAAKSLFIHRNTFLYRIEKIKAILNTDMNEAEDLFKYSLALKLHELQ